MIPFSQVDEITVQYNPSIRHYDRSVIKSSNDSFLNIRNFFCNDTMEVQEQFLVMYLNRANKVLGVYKMSTGGITSTIADVRLILSVALKTLATSIVLAHNHPSGNIKPSVADREITARIKQAAALMDISVFDHLILTKGNTYFSFMDEGLM